MDNKFDIEEQWEDLIEKYHIDCRNPGFRRKREAVSDLKCFFRKFKNAGKILLVGISQTDIEYLLNDIHNTSFYTEVLDSDVKRKISSQDYENYDEVIVVSFYCRRELVSLFHDAGIKAVSMYDYLECHGLKPEGNYYEVFHERWHEFSWANQSADYRFVDYSAVFFYDRRSYETAECTEIKKMYLQKMIFDCAYVKDFLALEEWIKEYQDKGYEEAVRYQQFMEEANRLLRSVKKRLEDRKYKDIVLFWLDQLEHGQDEDMPYLKAVSDRGITFENAYMSTPYTQPAAKLMFCKALAVDNSSFKIEKIEKNNSGVLQFLEATGYRFLYVGAMKWMTEEYKSTTIYSMYTPMSVYMWDCINYLINSHKPVFAVVHEIAETHNPNVSFGLRGNDYFLAYLKKYFKKISTKEKEIHSKQRESSCRYVDKQLEFYNGVLSKECTKIYMSDHGYTHGGRFHTILKIEGKQIQKQRIESMFSYEDFDKLVLYLCKDRKKDLLRQMEREFVRIQDVDHYNGYDIVHMLNKDGFVPLFGFQGVITSEDYYLCYNDGKEVYWNNAKPAKRITKEKLEHLRGLTSKVKIDIWKEEKFRYSRCMYQVVERYQKRNADFDRKLKQKIQNLFSAFKESSVVALRGGGYHSFEVWDILEPEQRDIIQYVIDHNKKCSMYKLGIPIITEREIEKHNIDVIITSSYDYEDEWVKQLQKDYPGKTVIGLYHYLRECGFTFNREFYFRPYIEEDFAIEIPPL